MASITAPEGLPQAEGAYIKIELSASGAPHASWERPVDAYVDLGELITDGTKALIDAMAEGLDVRFGSVVASVSTDDGVVVVTLTDGSRLEAPVAISSNTISSAMVPPKATLILDSNWLRVQLN